LLSLTPVEVELPEGVAPMVPVEDYSWVQDEAAVKAYYERTYQQELDRLLSDQVLIWEILF
jgi:hypothetical protein